MGAFSAPVAHNTVELSAKGLVQGQVEAYPSTKQHFLSFYVARIANNQLPQ